MRTETLGRIWRERERDLNWFDKFITHWGVNSSYKFITLIKYIHSGHHGQWIKFLSNLYLLSSKFNLIIITLKPIFVPNSIFTKGGTNGVLQHKQYSSSTAACTEQYSIARNHNTAWQHSWCALQHSTYITMQQYTKYSIAAHMAIVQHTHYMFNVHPKYIIMEPYLI